MSDDFGEYIRAEGAPDGRRRSTQRFRVSLSRHVLPWPAAKMTTDLPQDQFVCKSAKSWRSDGVD